MATHSSVQEYLVAMYQVLLTYNIMWNLDQMKAAEQDLYSYLPFETPCLKPHVGPLFKDLFHLRNHRK